MRPTGLDDLARAIADRTPIRWEELTADPAGPPPHLLSCARVVQQIAEVHAESAQTSIESSVEHGFERDTSAWAQPHRAPGPDNSWGSLRVGEKIGHGTFGDVYRAYDPHLDRPVALKLLRRRDKGEGAVVDEARLMARVRHPNVVTVFGADRVDGRVGIWMEYIEGRTVAADLAERGPFGVEEVVSIGVALCEALAAVHGAGLVHRDVKAQNILRNESGRIVLGDFGTGHDTGAGPSGAAALAGTPAYLAPEILQGQPATARSDLYGLGVLLFHLLTGSFPVGGTSYPALREAHQTGQRTPLRQRAPHVPADLAVVIETALAADPSQRFADAATMRSALGRSRSPARSRGLTKAAALAATLALVVSVLVVAAWQLTHRRFPSVSFGSRDSLLVAEFDNRTGESLLDDTPAVVMKRELANSRSINVVPHWRVSEALTLMRKPVDTRPGTALAREIALRDGQVRVVLGGSIGRLGDHYVLDADLVNVRDGHVIASLSEGPLKPADLLAGLRRLAHAVRLHLGDVPPQTEVAAVLPKVTTSSLRALQLYGHAARLERDEGAWGEHTPAAERLLQQAVREDPEFASAYIGLSIAARLQGRMAEARAHIERAVAFSERASETERLVAAAERDGVLGAMAVTVDERLRLKRLAAAGYAAVLEIQPDHHQAAVCLTNIHWSYLRVPNVQVATRLANQRPRSARWQLAAATFLLWNNPRDRALARPYIDRAASLSLLDPFNAYSVVAARVYGIYDAWLEMNPREAMRRASDLAAELATLPLPARHILAGQLSRAYIHPGGSQSRTGNGDASRIADIQGLSWVAPRGAARRHAHTAAVARGQPRGHVGGRGGRHRDAIARRGNRRSGRRRAAGHCSRCDPGPSVERRHTAGAAPRG